MKQVRKTKYIVSKMMFVILTICVVLFTPVYLCAQQSYAKKPVFELTGGWGTSAFFGDIGGHSRNGSNTSLLQGVDLSMVQPAYTVGLSTVSNAKLKHKYGLMFTRLEGMDFNSIDDLRRERNLSFQTSVVELTYKLEYRLFNLLGKKSINKLDYNLIAGVGLTYFEPKANYHNSLVSLRKLGTEGQGLIPGTKFYKPIVFVIPVGASLRYDFGENISFYGALNYNFTFTDYLDDVSGSYYNYDALLKYRGIVAAELSHQTTNGESARKGQRGNAGSKDSYATLTIGVSRLLRNVKRKTKVPSDDDFNDSNKF